jgi:hypothetical protein
MLQFEIYKGRAYMENNDNLKQTFNEKGEATSPVLADEIKNFLIDIDGTICDDIPNEEPERMANCLPFPETLKMLNKWHEEGHVITFFTSRTEEHRGVTEEWLKKHNIQYFRLIMNKPRGGNYHWIDNHIVKATRFNGKFSDLAIENQDIK